MSELKPCPFCGEENTDTGFILHKDECYLMLRYMGGHSKQEIINAWNTRPIEDGLQAEIDRLRVERRWIPVSERLPETNRSVLIFNELRLCQVAGHYPDGKWYLQDGAIEWQGVTHWMPLPAEPPEGEA